jgi:hypothetical protein
MKSNKEEVAMSPCCEASHNGETPVCPASGQATIPVSRKTVESLIKPELKTCLTPQSYFFCNAPDCDIIYVSEQTDHVITKEMIKTRVGIKETDDPVPLCYCFDYDRKAVRDDIRRAGQTDIQQNITERIKAGECRCEEMNPDGRCCLGNVVRSIKNAITLKEQGLL